MGLLLKTNAPKEKLHQLIMEHDKINNYMSSSYAKTIPRVFATVEQGLPW